MHKIHMPETSMTVVGGTLAKRLAMALIVEKIWFTVQPLPMDEYLFEVKASAGFQLNRALRKAKE